LLALVLGSAERDVVLAKVQELKRLLEPILRSKKSRRSHFALQLAEH
jgi:hypothetical protein